MMFMTEEQLETSLSRVNDWIKSVDQKISIALVFEVGVVTVIAKPVYEHISRHISRVNGLIETIIAITIILLSLSFLWCIFSLKPHLGKSDKNESVIYFGSIARTQKQAFIKKASKLSSADYFKDLSEQIHINSNIALRKHRLDLLNQLAYSFLE